MKHSIKLWEGVGIAIVIAIFGMVFIVGQSNKSTSGTKSGEPAPVTMSDWIKGNINAKVVLVEYADFQCPACSAYFPVVKRLEEKFGAEMAVVFRHFPLTQIHQNALLSAKAAEVAGRQGKFWEMHDLLFENQETWSKNLSARDIFIGYARQLKLDEDQFTRDLDNKDIQKKISASYEEGVLIGITGTPTFFLNGKKLTAPRTYEEFEKIILEKINQ